jgi:hypothetical protein
MCTETAAAAMPTSAGPISRATMKAEANDSPAAVMASSPDQKTLRAIRWVSGGGLHSTSRGHAWRRCRRMLPADDAGAAPGPLQAGSTAERAEHAEKPINGAAREAPTTVLCELCVLFGGSRLSYLPSNRQSKTRRAGT